MKFLFWFLRFYFCFSRAHQPGPTVLVGLRELQNTYLHLFTPTSLNLR